MHLAPRAPFRRPRARPGAYRVHALHLAPGRGRPFAAHVFAPGRVEFTRCATRLVSCISHRGRPFAAPVFAPGRVEFTRCTSLLAAGALSPPTFSPRDGLSLRVAPRASCHASRTAGALSPPTFSPRDGLSLRVAPRSWPRAPFRRPRFRPGTG